MPKVRRGHSPSKQGAEGVKEKESDFGGREVREV